jgi:hypothetical protein
MEFRLDNLRSELREMIVRKADDLFQKYSTSTISGSDRALFLLEREILTQELARREQEKQARSAKCYAVWTLGVAAIAAIASVFHIVVPLKLW